MRGVGVFIVPVLVGCGHAGDAAADSGTQAFCASDPRALAYVAGMERGSTAGAVRIRIAEAQPAPPGRGDNEWKFEVRDAGGAPVDGATIGVRPLMPDHGHGSSITPVVTAVGGGRYSLTRLNLFMPGLWTVTFTVGVGGVSGETVTFAFCVPS